MSIGKNMLVGIATSVTVFGLGIVLSVVLRRILGPEQSGLYVLLVTSNALLANIASLSVSTACSTLLARRRYRLGEVNTIAIILALALGAAGLALISLVFPFLSGNVFRGVPYDYLLVALLLLPATLYQIYWSAMMVGLNRLLLLNQFNLAINIGNTLLMILVVGVLRLGIPGFLVAWVVSALAGLLGAIILAARIERFTWPPSRAALTDMLRFGLRAHGTGIAHHLFLRFDMFAVNVFVGKEGVGYYSLATSLAEKLWVPLEAILGSSNSKIAQLPREESALLTAKMARTALVMMLGAAIPFAIVSPWLIPFLYGPEFAVSVLPLVILLFGTLGFAGMQVLNNYILGQMQRPGLLSVISWLELGISIPLYLALIMWQGIVGAAIASSLTYLLGMGGTLYVFIRNSGLPISQVFIPRSQDFRDYAHVLLSAIRRVPVLGRYIRYTF